jgi:hypothetical protein
LIRLRLTNDVNPVAGTLRAGLQGLTFGLSDEAGSAIAALAGSIKTGEKYSHSFLDSLGNEAEILQRPIAGRILLAGEALSDRSGYVDGAWNDGQRAASVIIDA